MQYVTTILTLSLLLLLTAGSARAQSPGWAVDPGNFTESMTITGQLQVDGAPSTDRNDRVAAFVDGQLRGVAQPFPNGFIFLNVYANQQGETITFKGYDADADADGEVIDLVGRQRFITNCTQGSASHPFVWRTRVPDGATWTAPNPGDFGETVNLGYRAPYVHELATRVSSGALELEALAEADLPTPELEKELLTIKGVGPYAAATLLMLVGRYDELAVDSVFREFVSERYFGGDRPTDAEARAVYEPWGRWRYLAYWFDLWAGLDERL